MGKLNILKPAPLQGEEGGQEEDTPREEGDLRHPPRPGSRLSAPGTRKALYPQHKNQNEASGEVPSGENLFDPRIDALFSDRPRVVYHRVYSSIRR